VDLEDPDIMTVV